MANETLPSEMVRLALRYYESLGSPISLSAAVKLRYGDWEGLANMSVDPRSYVDPQAYFADACAAGFLKKFQHFPGDPGVRRQRATAKWYEGEADCYHSNERLSRYLPEHSHASDRDAVVERLFRTAKKLILSWIGSRPPELLAGRFGPGATFSDRGYKSTVPHKMSSDPSMTRDAIWYLPQWYGTQWGHAVAQRRGKLSVVKGNRFTTVPKTALIDRPIGSEPSINMFYQLALGRVLRTRLRSSTGWDLDRAQDIHRQVAKGCSVSSGFDTLDLSNASDTVCKTLVRVLLPPDWFSQLDDLRSKSTLIDGKWVHLEKFSSMGNGFTFELETIVFAALIGAALTESGKPASLGVDFFVFGDDLIVPHGMTDCVKNVLVFSGFRLNNEKSFYDEEPFRESCGADYFKGEFVRPYQLKQLPSNPAEWITVANGLHRIRKLFERLGRHVDPDAWFVALDQIPSSVRRCRGPQALGDVVIHDDFWDINQCGDARYRYRNSIRYIRVFRPHRVRVISYDAFTPDVVLACATYGCGNRRGGVIPRDAVLSYKVGWKAYS